MQVAAHEYGGSKTFRLSDSDRHGRIFTVKALSADRNKFLHMASPSIQPPECYGPNIVGKFIHDELQNAGAVRSLLAGGRGFKHSHLDVRDF
jgi:hypothetical protein